MTDAQEEKPSKPVLWTNPLTLIGFLAVGMSVVLLVTFWIFVFITPPHRQTQYLGIIGYVILPMSLILGLVICPLGIVIKRWRLKRSPEVKQISVKAASMFLAITFFVTLPALGTSTYEGYEYTESTRFCGDCHAVMSPEYTAFPNTVHANITCAGCHVGPGAEGFVGSKLTGVRQLFLYATDTYSRPIPPALPRLAPATQTCERCHSRHQFFGWDLQRVVHFSHDAENTRHEYEMILKVNGKKKHPNRPSGIHKHTIEQIEYAATDEHLQTIPWVRQTAENGEVTIFRSDGKRDLDPPPDAPVMRKMDCMDCHNRSGHQFESPETAVDAAIDSGLIDASLPYVKRQSVSVLSRSFANGEDARSTIAEAIDDFYHNEYTELLPSKMNAIQKTIKCLQDIYAKSTFPHMKVDWKTYPDNMGHMYSPGCFRCHDGRHVSSDGKRITSDCKACHLFIRAEAGGEDRITGEFVHPMRISSLPNESHETLRCNECHTGAGTGSWGTKAEHQSACGDCHASGRWLTMKKNTFQPTTRPSME